MRSPSRPSTPAVVPIVQARGAMLVFCLGACNGCITGTARRNVGHTRFPVDYPTPTHGIACIVLRGAVCPHRSDINAPTLEMVVRRRGTAQGAYSLPAQRRESSCEVVCPDCARCRSSPCLAAAGAIGAYCCLGGCCCAQKVGVYTGSHTVYSLPVQQSSPSVQLDSAESPQTSQQSWPFPQGFPIINRHAVHDNA